MSFETRYASMEPARDAVDAIAGPVLVEFGAPWCGHCAAAQPLIEAAFEQHPDVRHIKIADGSGRRLGRSFGVKLWPTLVFLRDGREISRLVRPRDRDAVARAFEQLDGAGPNGASDPR